LTNYDKHLSSTWIPGQIANKAILLADVSEAGEMVDSLMWLQRCNFLHGNVCIIPDQSRPKASKPYIQS